MVFESPLGNDEGEKVRYFFIMTNWVQFVAFFIITKIEFVTFFIIAKFVTFFIISNLRRRDSVCFACGNLTLLRNPPPPDSGTSSYRLFGPLVEARNLTLLRDPYLRRRNGVCLACGIEHILQRNAASELAGAPPLPWREASSSNHHDDKVNSDQ